MPGPTLLTTQTAARSLHAHLHNYATESPLVTMGPTKSTPKLTLAVRQSPTPTICLILRPSRPTSRTASRSNQPFFHNTPDS